MWIYTVNSTIIYGRTPEFICGIIDWSVVMKAITKVFIGVVLFIPLLISTQSWSAQSWQAWIADLRKEALAQGIRPTVFDTAFAGIKPNKRVIHFDRTQPEKRLTFLEYRRTRIDPYRITLGVREYKRNREILNEVGSAYGVDSCFILAFWGIESSYGRFLGNFSVIKSLATLAYDGRRSEFFRKELLLALHILNEGHVNPKHFKGEWAGASGQPQFLPSSWHKYAVDYDQDGRKDIWRTYPDAFASIANYLIMNGWETGAPWSVEVEAPYKLEHLQGYKQSRPLYEWQQMGVQLKTSHTFNDDRHAYLIEPYGGPAFLVFKNFRVIMSYNNSTYYAGSVGYLADQICAKVHYVKR